MFENGVVLGRPATALLAVLAFTMAVAACGSVGDEATGQGEAIAGSETTDEAPPTDDPGSDPTGTSAEGDELDEGCSPDAIGEEDGRIVAIERVVDGELGPRCFGVAVASLDAAWEILATVTDVAQRSVITHLVAFESEGDTLAFAGPVDPDDNASFYVAVDAGAVAVDPEFRVTVVHELAHVLTTGPDELDATGSAFECDTWFTGYGCPLPGSVIDEFVAAFWTDAALAALPVTGEPDLDGGDDRCSLDPAFVGPYAASHPEEDLAESFAAYVLDIDVADEAAPKLDFFDEWPEFVAVRERARAAGFGVSVEESGLEGCG